MRSIKPYKPKLKFTLTLHVPSLYVSDISDYSGVFTLRVNSKIKKDHLSKQGYYYTQERLCALAVSDLHFHSIFR